MPAPGKRTLTASIQRKASDGPVRPEGAVSSDAGVRGDSPQDLMDFFMGPAPAAPAMQKSASAAVADAFDSIARRAGEALSALEQTDQRTPDHAARDKLVAIYAAQIEVASTSASWLVQQVPEGEREAFKAPADRAADRVHALLTWIMSRTGNHQMRQRVEATMRTVDAALESVGAEAVTARSTPALRGTESIEAADERAALLEAQQDHAIALRELRDAKIHQGIEPFHDLAALEDNPDPSFVAELLKAILVASIGHIAGGLFGTYQALTTRVPIPPSGAFRAAALDRLKDVTIDSVQGIGGKAADGAFAESRRDKNALTKARTYFVAGLKTAAGEEQSFHEQLIATEVSSGTATAASLRDETALIRAMKGDVGAIYLQRASAGWASYLAQQSLGKTGKRDDYGRRASNMDHFLGEAARQDDPHGERVFGTSKAQTDGVLHVHLEIDADPRHGSKAKIRRQNLTIEGVNNELRQQILREAGGNIGKVWLPKVVYVSMANNSFHAAQLALDERNLLRDHVEWDSIRRHTQHVPDHTYESPEAFAKHLVAIDFA